MDILDTLKNKSQNSKQNTILRKAENRKQVTSNHKQVLLSAFRLFDYLVVKAFPLSAFYVVTVFCFFSAFLLSCNNSTDPKEDLVTFSGTVTLEDTTDYSGVTVSLYAPVELDTALVRINQEYPNIGVQISQETEFDHREHEALYSTTTNANGSWEIKAEEGTYNVVIAKEGWGWKYEFDSSNKTINYQLSRRILLSGNITDYFEISENSFVLVENNTTVTTNGTLKINPGVIINFKESSKLTIDGKLLINGTEQNKVLMTSEPLGNYAKIIFQNTCDNLLHNVIIRKIEEGTYIKGCTNIQLSNIHYSNNNVTLELFNSSDIVISDCNIVNSNIGVEASESKIVFKNNLLFENTEAGVIFLNDQISEFSYNLTEKCENYGISINPGSNKYSISATKILYNDFENNQVHIFIGVNGAPQINYNNLLNAYEYKIVASQYSPLDSIDAKYNYWIDTQSEYIDISIDDKEDHLGEEYEGPKVDYSEYSLKYIQ
jgi:hypothetical protein